MFTPNLTICSPASSLPVPREAFRAMWRAHRIKTLRLVRGDRPITLAERMALRRPRTRRGR